MPKKNYQDDELRNKRVKDFVRGYNSYTLSNTLVDDQEFSQGRNVVLDNNGAVTKVAGYSKFTGSEVSTGNPITGLGWLKNTTNNKVIAASGTQWFSVESGTPAALTGMTFAANKDTDFAQAIDRLYGANGVDNLAYTSNGTSITEVTANGNIGRWPISYNRRLYMTNTANPDRIYYSNPYGLDLTQNPPLYTTSDFGTFNTDLGASPKKNAGFIILMPGAGVEIVRLFLDNTFGTDYIYAFTRNHGTWQIAYSATNSDSTLVHTITQVSTNIGSESGRSVLKAGNDIWFYDRDNIYTLGEVAQYQNIRTSPKAARIKAELDSIAPSGISKLAAGFFENKIYFAYQTGTYNDRMIIYDMILNAWSSPIIGKNVSCFLDWEDNNGVHRFLAGSSNAGDSHIYELNTGLNDASTAVAASFTTKSYDCDKPGLIKRFAFIDVFYSLVFGTLDYEVFLDETSSLTGTLQLGSSSTGTAGIGWQQIGGFMVGDELQGSVGDILRFNKFRIPCRYKAGQTISVKFSNANLDENFRINGMMIWFIDGEIYES